MVPLLYATAVQHPRQLRAVDCQARLGFRARRSTARAHRANCSSPELAGAVLPYVPRRVGAGLLDALPGNTVDYARTAIRHTTEGTRYSRHGWPC